MSSEFSTFQCRSPNLEPAEKDHLTLHKYWLVVLAAEVTSGAVVQCVFTLLQYLICCLLQQDRMRSKMRWDMEQDLWGWDWFGQHEMSATTNWQLGLNFTLILHSPHDWFFCFVAPISSEPTPLKFSWSNWANIRAKADSIHRMILVSGMRNKHEVAYTYTTAIR